MTEAVREVIGASVVDELVKVVKVGPHHAPDVLKIVFLSL